MSHRLILGLLVAWCVSLGSIARADRQAGEALNKLLDDAWQFKLTEDPLFATQVGEHRYNDLLPRETVADYQRRLEAQREFLARLEAIDRDALTADEQINYDIFARQTADQLAEHAFRSYLMPITNRWGFHTSFPELPKDVPLETIENYESYIKRLDAFTTYARQHIELMREGIAAGLVLPEVAMRDSDEPIAVQIVDDPTQSLLYEPFKRFPDSFTPQQRERLEQAGRRAIAESVVPGYREFLDFMKREYLPVARTSIGISGLPGGREYYRQRVRKYTTLDLTPEQVHQTGLDEVNRIRAEMEAAREAAEFDGTLAEFIEFLRTDPRFYPQSADELLKEVSFVLKQMDGRLPDLFGKLPRMSYGIREVPAYIAPRTTTAYYQPPTGDGTKAGFYFVNTYDLASRPLFEVQALSLHEAVPGHHLQIALQQELDELPPMRRFGGFTAFVEGWGLYAERLGLEVGFYQDPYSNFGRLSYEMWRACRLVVDTGMHYLGWSRQQAIDFMLENTALTRHNIEAEVDRYISWPGQALAYKTGELKIRGLRAEAEERLGPQFDLRAFHDVVLGSGSVPLDVLEMNVRGWIDGQLQAETASN